MIRKKVRDICIVLGAVVSCGAIPCMRAATAYAQESYGTTAASGNTSDTSRSSAGINSIWSGLWEGVNMATGGFSGTASTNTGQATSGQTPATTSSTGGTYAALGDSVAAGVGLTNPVTVPNDETHCGRTSEAYPYQVAQSMGLRLTHVACSGATIGDLFTVQRSGSPNLPPQLDAAFAGGTPNLITITAGANDIHWTQFISSCYYTNCANGPASPSTDCPAEDAFFSTTTLANCYIRLMQAKMYVALSDIWLKSNGNPPTTVITGYDNPVSTACASQFDGKVTADEINWINGEINALNQTLQGVAASYSFVRFAPVSFAGHDVCSGSSWVQTTADPEPFHPTAAGQQVIARSVLSVLGH